MIDLFNAAAAHILGACDAQTPGSALDLASGLCGRGSWNHPGLDLYGPTTITTVITAFLGWQLFPIDFFGSKVTAYLGFEVSLAPVMAWNSISLIVLSAFSVHSSWRYFICS